MAQAPKTSQFAKQDPVEKVKKNGHESEAAIVTMIGECQEMQKHHMDQYKREVEREIRLRVGATTQKYAVAILDGVDERMTEADEAGDVLQAGMDQARVAGDGIRDAEISAGIRKAGMDKDTKPEAAE